MLGQILVNSASYWGDKELIAVNFGNNVQLYELSELGLV